MQDLEVNGEIKYAGFWRRLASYIVDFFILILPIVGIQYFIFGGFEDGQKVFVDQVINLLVWCIYYVLLETSKWQGTIGKKLVGIKVTNIDGGKVTISQALIRYWMILPACLLFFIGIIMIAFTEKNKAFMIK